MGVYATCTVVLSENIVNERSPGLVVGMLAAETPSVDGHLAASTPRRRGNANTIYRKLTFGSINLPTCLLL